MQQHQTLLRMCCPCSRLPKTLCAALSQTTTRKAPIRTSSKPASPNIKQQSGSKALTDGSRLSRTGQGGDIRSRGRRRTSSSRTDSNRANTSSLSSHAASRISRSSSGTASDQAFSWQPALLFLRTGPAFGIAAALTAGPLAVSLGSPPLTAALVATNLAVHTAQAVPDSGIVRHLAQNHAHVVQGEWWRLVTYAFVHKDMPHLLGNMAALLWLGAPLEHAVGLTGLAAIYASATLSAGLMQQLVCAEGYSGGASGAVFGILGAWAVLGRTPAETALALNHTSADAMFWYYLLAFQLAAAGVCIVLGMQRQFGHWAHVAGCCGGACSIALFVAAGGWVASNTDAMVFPWLPF